MMTMLCTIYYIYCAQYKSILLSILPIVYTNIVHPMMILFQILLSIVCNFVYNFTSILYISYILHELQFIVHICQYCTILSDIVRKIALVWFADVSRSLTVQVATDSECL